MLGAAPEGAPPDIEYMQTYASGPVSQVNSIIWPNPAFDNNITVFGPEVKALAGRYLVQMIDELRALPDPDGEAASLLDSIELIIPHQANKTMVIDLATGAGSDARPAVLQHRDRSATPRRRAFRWQSPTRSATAPSVRRSGSSPRVSVPARLPVMQ